MTSAETISRLFGDDGLQYFLPTDPDVDILDVCRTMGASFDQSWERDSTRCTFPDRSAITVSGGAWDLGYPECFCWQGGGHDAQHCEQEAPRRAYIEQCGGQCAAIAFEEQVLGSGCEYPDVDTPEYWTWLSGQREIWDQEQEAALDAD